VPAALHRVFLKKLLLATVLSPALVAALCVGAEGVLLASGVCARGRWFVESGARDATSFVLNPDRRGRHFDFRVERFRKRPPAGARRIVCCGDSTCYGTPFDPPVPYASWIGTRLAADLPDVPTEVVNLGMMSMCSSELADLVEETGAAGADVLVVYVGHNQVLDPDSLPITRPFAYAVRRAFAATRCGSLLLDVVRRSTDAPAQTGGACRERIRDEPDYTAAEIARGRARYRANLRRIVASARAHAAAVLLVHPICDFVDTQVYASSFSASFPAPARDDYRRTAYELVQTRKGLDHAAANGQPVDPAEVRRELAVSERLLALDDGVALVHYETGRLLLLAGRVAEAHASFARAAELDTYPVRADAALHRILDEVAAETGATVVDPRPRIDEEAAPRLPGQDGWFVDYCHPDMKGHALIAAEILRALRDTGRIVPPEQWRIGSLELDEEYLWKGGWTAASQAASWARTALLRLCESRFDPANERPLDVAGDLCRRALAIDPGCVDAWVGCGTLHAIRHESGPALDAFERAAAVRTDALSTVAAQYRGNAAVRKLFSEAGLCVRDGRVVAAR